jgi:hypothetical protein
MRTTLLALLLTVGSLTVHGQAPDCQFTQTFTATGYGVTTSNQAVSNVGTQCVTWRLSYYADNMTALSIQVEGAPDASGSHGTFAAVPTTACSSTQQPPCTLDGTNPLTDTNHATVAFRGYYAWMALQVTVFTHSGTSGLITARMYGYKGTSPAASYRGGSGGSGIAACGTTPPTIGTAGQTCYDTTGALWVCHPSGACTVAANWVGAVPYTGAVNNVALGAHGITGASFTGDSGSGGTTGLVPAPAAGDAAAGKYLSASGGYAVPPGANLAPGASLFSSTTTAGPNNSAAETSVIGTVVGSKTITANTFSNGSLLQAHAQGFFSLPAVSDSLTLKMKCGTTVIGSAVLTPTAGALTNGSWRFWLDISGRGTGAAGTFISNGLVELSGSALSATTAKVLNTTTVAFDFTTACVFDVTAQWGAAQSGETLQGTNVAAWFPGAGNAPYSCTLAGVSSIACTHNLGTATPGVWCYDASGNMLGGTGATTSVTSVVATSINVATLTFSGSTTGACLISTGSMGPQGAVGPTGAAGGAQIAQDLGGTTNLPKVVGIQGVPVLSTTPTSSQVLTFNGTQWGPAAGGGGGGPTAYTLYSSAQRLFNTAYHNTGTSALYVAITANHSGSNAELAVLLGSANPPTDNVEDTYSASYPGQNVVVFFIVPPGYWYEASTYNSVTFGIWTEWH